MSEMVERMLAGALGAELDRAGYGWAGKRALCRLMIEAMREPTDAMVAAPTQDEIEAIWKSMIDEALK